MCGIAGITGTRRHAEGQQHEAVLRQLAHRGPDARQFAERPWGTLYHTRLSIIDPSTASNQPFGYPDSNDALVYNGEIFNYRELAAGITDLRTSGDVEVLYRLLREKGAGALPALNGFFAFAWFAADGSFLLARDRFGVKPLYYSFENGTLAFASELRSLLALTGPRPLNADQLYTYFRLNYCAGEQTVFKGIYRLLPGELLKFDGNKITRTQWYQAEPGERRGDLYALLDDAVRIRLRADVPVGAFLSGGLDSSIISALAKKHQPALETFSIGFSDHPYLDESPYAAMVAKHIGTRHHLIRLNEDDLLAHMEPFLRSIDEPFADSSAFNLYMLAMHTRKHVKVALTGDGADEFFSGYRKHRAQLLAGHPVSAVAARAADLLTRPFSSSRSSRAGDRVRQISRLAAASRLNPEKRTEYLASVSSHQEVADLLRFPFDPSCFSELFTGEFLLRGFSPGQHFDIAHVLSDDMLVKTDRFSMRHGLELRSPFLDVRVTEYALGLARDKKISMHSQKIILRETFGHLLPPAILARPKKGFEVPVERWLKGKLWEKINDVWLHEQTVREEGLLNEAAVAGIKRQLFSKRPGDAPARLWALIVFRQWMENFSGVIKKTGGRPMVA